MRREVGRNEPSRADLAWENGLAVVESLFFIAVCHLMLREDILESNAKALKKESCGHAYCLFLRSEKMK